VRRVVDGEEEEVERERDTKTEEHRLRGGGPAVRFKSFDSRGRRGIYNDASPDAREVGEGMGRVVGNDGRNSIGGEPGFGETKKERGKRGDKGEEVSDAR
jgi:hypothetical protein